MNRIVITENTGGDKPQFRVISQRGWWLFWYRVADWGTYPSLSQALLNIERLHALARRSRAQNRMTRQQRRELGRKWAKNAF